MNLVKVEYNANLNMCSEIKVESNISPEIALSKLKSANFPAYIYEPLHVGTPQYFATEIKNNLCKKEYNKIKD